MYSTWPIFRFNQQTNYRQDEEYTEKRHKYKDRNERVRSIRVFKGWDE